MPKPSHQRAEKSKNRDRPPAATGNGGASRRPPEYGIALADGERGQFRTIPAPKQLQRKPVLSAPQDASEREADDVAERVMRMAVQPAIGPASPAIRRKCSRCEEVDQKIFLKGASTAEATTNLDTAAAVQATERPGSPLPDAVRDYFEPRFGYDFRAVRVHADQDAARAARAVKARAYTWGRHIVFGSSEYSPSTAPGMRLLAHELAHVVQQGRGQSLVQRTVDEVFISCADNRVDFHHDDQTTSYELNHCDVTPGTYEAQVHLGQNRVDFDLGTSASGVHFDFGYRIAPGLPNPSTFFAGQRTVRIVSSSGSNAAIDGSYHFNVTSLSAEALRSIAGIAPSALPERVMIPLASIAGNGGTQRSGRDTAGPSILTPAGVGASYFSPTPFSLLPPNSTGVLWTNGHTSIWSNPQSALFPTVRGFRGNMLLYLAEMLPGSTGRSFTVRLHEGVPGSFANDALFPLMPGEQSYLYVIRDAEQAARFAETLRTTRHPGQYTYSPPRSQGDPILGDVGPSEMEMYEILTSRGRAPMCTNNCITLPSSEIEGAIGMRPTTTSGVDVMTGQTAEGVVDPHYAGRGRLMTEAMAEGPLAPGVGRLNLRVTTGGAASMFLIRGGGRVLLVYGIYKTEERIRGAVGTDQLPTVIAEEGGSWAGGILGSALGGAAAGALFCAPTGPVDAVCVVGGFLGGLLFGAAGGTLGSELGHTAVEGRPPEGGVLDTVTRPLLGVADDLANYLDYNIRRLYGLPF